MHRNGRAPALRPHARRPSDGWASARSRCWAAASARRGPTRAAARRPGLRRRDLPVRLADRRAQPRVPLRPGLPQIVQQDLQNGQHRNPEQRPHWFTTADFIHPDELRQEATAVDFEVVEALGIEGVAGWLRHIFDRRDDPAARGTILFAARTTEAEPSLLGASGHLAMVCRQPTPGATPPPINRTANDQLTASSKSPENVLARVGSVSRSSRRARCPRWWARARAAPALAPARAR